MLPSTGHWKGGDANVSDEDFVPVPEIAAHFGLTRAAIYKYVKLGKIEARRLGGAVRITRDEFERLKREGLRAGTSGNKMTPELAAA
jgi:excisionase family DNA binding protein